MIGSVRITKNKTKNWEFFKLASARSSFLFLDRICFISIILYIKERNKIRFVF